MEYEIVYFNGKKVYRQSHKMFDRRLKKNKS